MALYINWRVTLKRQLRRGRNFIEDRSSLCVSNTILNGDADRQLSIGSTVQDVECIGYFYEGIYTTVNCDTCRPVAGWAMLLSGRYWIIQTVCFSVGDHQSFLQLHLCSGRLSMLMKWHFYRFQTLVLYSVHYALLKFSDHSKTCKVIHRFSFNGRECL